MTFSKKALYKWCQAQFTEQCSLLKTLAAIPAPSHMEDLRAEFIRKWLTENGAASVRIDEAKNVVLELRKTDAPMLAVLAHTDVVFPDEEPLPVHEENGKLYAPGIGDDTANVVALMLCAKFFLTSPELIPEPLLIVFNSCEEGLGNLKGVRQIMADYEGQIRALVSFDCQYNSIVSRAVGSERWKVSVSTSGGHSFSDFGSPNAIVHLSRLIDRLYQQTVPEKEDSKTTYNVGLISGGTSVNTIAQQAEMVYEYRSNDKDCLDLMSRQFHALLEEAGCAQVAFTLQELGIRPCGGSVPYADHAALLTRCRSAIHTVTGEVVPFCAASTDANIPLSMGIPAATFGLYIGGGAHTREEFVRIDSLTTGLKIALCFFFSDHLTN